MIRTISVIAAELFLNPEIDNCIAKVVPPRHRDDFKQELFQIILEDKTGSFQRADNDGKVFFQTVRTILNLAHFQRGVFHKKYLNHERSMSEYTELVAC